MPHRARVPGAQRLWPHRVPLQVEGICRPGQRELQKVDVPNARWHEAHTFTCFAYPTYTESDMEQIAAAILKVIQAYSK